MADARSSVDVTSSTWTHGNRDGRSSAAGNSADKYDHRPGHGLSRRRNARQRNPVGKLARVHNSAEPGGRGRNGELSDRRRWICEPEPDTECQRVADRKLLHRGLSPERWDGEPGILGGPGIGDRFDSVGKGAAGTFHGRGTVNIKGLCRQRDLVAEWFLVVAGWRYDDGTAESEYGPRFGKPGCHQALCRSAGRCPASTFRRNGDGPPEYQTVRGLSLRRSVAIGFERQPRNRDVFVAMPDASLRLPGAGAVALRTNGSISVGRLCSDAQQPAADDWATIRFSSW